MDQRLLGLILVFAPLSLFSFGGGQAITADIHNQTVLVQGWLSEKEFTDLFALSRAAPGPTTLIAALIGWHVSGLLGAIVAALAIYIPSSAMMYFAARWWHSKQDWHWRRPVERGLAPVALGLIFAAVITVIQAAHMSIVGIGVALVCAGFIYFTRVSAYMLIAVVGIFYTGLQFI
jgi:chromate transporter